MLSTEDLTELIIAVTGLISATALLVAALRNIHLRIDQNQSDIADMAHELQSSSTKVLPRNNP